MRKCKVCSEIKAEELFTTKRTYKSHKCKSCTAQYQREWASKNPQYLEAHRETRKKYEKTPKGKAANGRKNSKRRYMVANQVVSEEALALEKQFRLSMTECANCKTTDRLSLDHIIPLSKGGPHDPSNWQCLCIPCNSAKRDFCLL